MWNDYAADVAAGRIPACLHVKRAVRRYLDDMTDAYKRGIHFDMTAARHAIDFFGFLHHSKGEWAGQPLTLEPWQQFIIANLFGWLRYDGTRRFRVAYIEVPRKNGKSTLASGIGLYLFDADGEAGAEVYTAATKRDQARITHAEATRMVKASPFLRRRIRTFRDNLNVEGTAAKFEPLGRDADTMDGLNIHGAIVDELHAHKTREVWDVLETGIGARQQPMMVAITTAGYSRQSICWEMHDYTEKVLTGIVQDDAHFGIIYSIDRVDPADPTSDWEDWREPNNWRKANPNYAISVKVDDLQRKALKAAEMPSALNAFLRLHLNIWTQAETAWLNPDTWQACAGSVDADSLRGRTCYGGLDLSRTTDYTAFVLVFPPTADGEPYRVLCRFWIPDAKFKDRKRADRVPVDAWVRQGYITVTPGEVIDYEYIYQQIDDDAQRYDLQEIAFDRWGAAQVYQEVEKKGIDMIQFGQGFASMSSPMKELEKLLLAKGIHHGANPVLSWMAANTVATQDAAGNLKPDKEKSTDRIDGIVALIMGLDRATRGGDSKSIYEEQELRSL